MRSNAGRYVAALFVVTGGALAWSFGGHDASSATAPPPRGDSAENALDPFAPVSFDDRSGSTSTGASNAANVDTTAFRLVDSLQNAHLDIPNLARAEATLATQDWRHMRTPWLSLTGTPRRVAMTIALAVGEKEAKDVTTQRGDVWHPTAQTWNMNEGDFPEKDAFFAPTPSTIGVTHAIPPHARFVFSTALAVSTPNDVTFQVYAGSTDRNTDAKDAPIFEETRRANEPYVWKEHSIDLSAFAGHDVELRLETRIASGKGAASSSSTNAAAPALWGNPRVLARQAKAIPYNVLWIVIDALRPDVPASLHDDEDDQRVRAAHHPIGDALLPKIAGLTPNIDALAAKAVHFTHAYSAAAWTRPGTVAMLSGARASELHLSTLFWLVTDSEAATYYGESPALLPRLMNEAGADTRAFVNNYFMVGYAPVGLDMGFPELDDHRYRLLDTRAIADDAVGFIESHANERFFAFCNFNSPHEPYEPPERLRSRVPPPPAGPTDWHVQMYMGEAAKDDEAVGQLMEALEKAKIADRTVVVITSDHGETLSAAHGGTSELDNQAVRFHHAASNYEETTHVPLIVALPGHPDLLPPGGVVRARVRSTDIAPTVLDLEGLADAVTHSAPGMSGTSLLALAQGKTEPDERVVVSEGRGTRAILAGKWRLLTREGQARITHFDDRDVTASEELFDLDDDPGEKHDVAKEHADVVAEMRARLQAALSNTPVAGTNAARAAAQAPPAATATAAARAHGAAATGGGVWHLRFAGGGAAHRISGVLHAKPFAAEDVHLSFAPVGLPAEELRANGADLELAFSTSADDLVGVDVTLEPPDSRLTWELFEDDAQVSPARMYGGEFGLPLASTATATAPASSMDDLLLAASLPVLDAKRDHGVFVTREPIHVVSGANSGAAEAPTRPTDPRAAKEMSRMMQQWGYARGTPR